MTMLGPAREWKMQNGLVSGCFRVAWVMMASGSELQQGGSEERVREPGDPTGEKASEC